jgi:hypothetical protein
MNSAVLSGLQLSVLRVAKPLDIEVHSRDIGNLDAY